jgi:hypothetical protein
MQMYVDDNRGHLPPTLGKLFPYIGDGRIFLGPGSLTPAPRSDVDVDAGQCDFIYNGAGMQASDEDANETVIIETKPGFPYSCVYLDGHVESGPEAFTRARQKAMERENAKTPAEEQVGEQ